MSETPGQNPRTLPPSDEVLSEAEFERTVSEDIGQTRDSILGGGIALPLEGTWERASALVEDFRLVPLPLWIVVRGVLGELEGIKKNEPGLFTVVEPVLKRAFVDSTLGRNAKSNGDAVPGLSGLVAGVGPDVSGALAFLYSVCRRVSTQLEERTWRPIIDDALLRAQIGYFVGNSFPRFGAGRGILAGFSGRAGLAIQIAAGDAAQAEAVIERLAVGDEIKDVGLSTYDCEPLQVSAMALVAGGLPSQAAFGTAHFARSEESLVEDTLEYRWLAAFSIIEQLRLGHSNLVPPKHWDALGFSDSLSREALIASSTELLRRGHTWHWLAEPLLSEI